MSLSLLSCVCVCVFEKDTRNLINTELIHISIVENKQSIRLRTHLTDIFFPFVHLHP